MLLGIWSNVPMGAELLEVYSTKVSVVIRY